MFLWEHLGYGVLLTRFFIIFTAIMQGASSTSSHADYTGDRQSLRIKKVISRYGMHHFFFPLSRVS